MEWSRDSRFGPRLGAADSAWLVLDGTAERILLASAAAAGLAQALTRDDSGRMADAIRLGDQIRPRGLPLDRPALVKLRFDARRLGPASTCLVLRTKDAAGRNVLILALLDRLPALRPSHRPASPDAGADTLAPSEPPAPVEEAASVAQAAETEVAASPRIVWRSDAEDRLTDVSGPAAASVGPALIGRTWAALSQTRTLLDAEGLLLALAERRTFRSIAVTLNLDGPPGALDLDISGTPAQRADAPFKGFNGFALVRPSSAPPDRRSAAAPAEAPVPVARPREERAAAPDVVPPSAGRPETARRAPSLPVAQAWPGPSAGGAPEARTAPAAREAPENETLADAPVVEDLLPEDSLPEDFLPEDSRAAVEADPPPSRDPHLSSHEHAAFREIARALGARFAGDADPDESPSPAGEAGEAGSGGSVTPFPAPSARPAEPAPAAGDAAVVATLERLPGGVLVYRGASVLFANRSLLDLAGFSDLAALTAAGGLGRLFGGLAPHERRAEESPAILTDASGRSLGVDIQGSEIDWRGAPARLLLVRDAAASEGSRERAALEVADAFAGARAADAQAVLDSLEDGIVTLDRNARIVGLNRSAATLFGLDPREIVGSGILGLFAPESAVVVLAGLHGTGAPPPCGVTGRTAAGPVPLTIRVAPLPGRDDGRMSMTIREVRAGRPLAAEPVQARRAADYAGARTSDFLARISHEIRTPMNGILGFADMMLAEPFGPLGHERYRDYLGDIHASGSHVLGLVDDLLDLARIEAGRMDLTPAEIPLNDLVSQCVALLQPQAMRDRIVVRTSFSDDLSPLVADERSVRQAALNVIANAIAFTEAGGQVIVSTTMADRGEIALRVRDTGIGMTADEVETALEPFRQIALAGVPRGKAAGKGVGKGAGRGTGTGLGLPLTKALVEANHGRFRIESRKDEGTLVEMLFPPLSTLRTA